MVTATGKILRFDEFRGYGFIAPDDGGDDVFMHANDLRDEKYLFRPGARVAFEVEDGDRGLKASDVRIVERVNSTVIGRPAGPAMAAIAGRSGPVDDDEAMCDVLSVDEFRGELTETLIAAAPSLTAAQIVQVRQRLLDLAKSHNWVEA